jgi:Zn-dependent M28 family amino/carboxypeptidase
MIKMPLKSYSGPWVPLSAEESALKTELARDVQHLAGDIGERHVFRPNSYAAAVAFIEQSFQEVGYEVTQQPFTAHGRTCLNLEVTITGVTRPDEIVVVGAHYDTVIDCPGANDNGSAVAALLALSRRFGESQPERTLRFVAFANEEPPFFQGDGMGSLAYARRCRATNDNVVAMISLETIGYYSDMKGSQKYPFPIGLFYPSTGDFIAFVGNRASKGLVQQCVASFRRQVKFPSEGAALPGVIPGIGWSDHWSFWQTGYPAIMVTDTAPFRYPYYHTPEDTPDRLDYERLARVVAGLEIVIAELVDPHP